MLTLHDSTGRAYTEEQIAGISSELERRVKTHRCRACGSEDLFWYASNKNHSDVTEGRLRTGDISCSFILGCNYCSETLLVLSADVLATGMTKGLDPLYSIQLEGNLRKAEADKDRVLIWLAERDVRLAEVQDSLGKALELLEKASQELQQTWKIEWPSVPDDSEVHAINAFIALHSTKGPQVFGMNFEVFNTPEEITARIVELAGTAKAIIRGTNGSVHTLKWN